MKKLFLRKKAFSGVLTILFLAAFTGTGVAVARDCWNYQPANMKPQPGWESAVMDGMTRLELLEDLGCPPHSIRMTSVRGAEFNRELWVYHPYDEDSTALHVWIKGDRFHRSSLDTFTGFWTHEMDNPDFWE